MPLAPTPLLSVTSSEGLAIIVLVLFVLGVLAALWGVGVFNKLVSKRNRYKNAFAQIDVQLKRARAQATQAQVHVGGDPTDTQAMARLQSADGALTSSLGRLLAVAENYPELKSNQTMMQLSEELTSTENKVAFSRQAYNEKLPRVVPPGDPGQHSGLRRRGLLRAGRSQPEGPAESQLRGFGRAVRRRCPGNWQLTISNWAGARNPIANC